MTTKNCSSVCVGGAIWSLEDKLCVMQWAEEEKLLKPFGGVQKIVNGSQTLDIEIPTMF